MAGLCSVTSSKKILKSYRRKRNDDRPFARSTKAILPIRGFKGNRILYGDSLDAVNEVTEEDEDEDDDCDDDDNTIEPVYSEPQFILSEDSQLSSSDTSSGYLSNERTPPLSHGTCHNNYRNNNITTTTTITHSLSSPESGYLSSDEDCLIFQQDSPRPPYRVYQAPPAPTSLKPSPLSSRLPPSSSRLTPPSLSLPPPSSRPPPPSTRPAPPPYRPPPAPSSSSSISPTFSPTSHSSPISQPRLSVPISAIPKPIQVCSSNSSSPLSLPPKPHSPPDQILTESSLINTILQQSQQEIFHTRIGHNHIQLVDGEHGLDDVSLQLLLEHQVDKIVLRGVLQDTRLGCLHKILHYLYDDWVAQYLVHSIKAIYILSKDINCSVECNKNDITLNCQVVHCSFGSNGSNIFLQNSDMETLCEDLENYKDNDLAEIVSHLLAINVAAEDVLRVMAAKQLLDQLQNNKENKYQRLDSVKILAKLLGVSCDKLQVIVCSGDEDEDNKDLNSLLSNFLIVKTIKSIVKKVNRTLVRRTALKTLCDDKVENTKNSCLKLLLVDDKVDNDSDEGADILQDGDNDVTDIMKMNLCPLPPNIQEMFNPSLCTFGFAAHLFAQDTESSISSTTLSLASKSNMSSRTLFCLQANNNIVDQVRDLDILEHLIDINNQLWQCLPLHQFYITYRCLFNFQRFQTNCNLTDDLIRVVMEVIDDEDDMEINDDTGMVMIGTETQRRMDMKMSRVREKSAMMIQKWWRRLLWRDQQQPKMIFSEHDLIQTVLRKYETLQRQSQSLVYNFTERNIRHSECDEYDSMEDVSAPTKSLAQGTEMKSTSQLEDFTFQDSGVYEGEEYLLEKDEGYLHETSKDEDGDIFSSTKNPPKEDGRLRMPSPTMEDVGSLSEVQAVPALILDHDNPYGNLSHYNDNDDEDPDDIVMKTSQFYGIDLSIPPPLPSRRDYRVDGGVKIYYRYN